MHGSRIPHRRAGVTRFSPQRLPRPGRVGADSSRSTARSSGLAIAHPLDQRSAWPRGVALQDKCHGFRRELSRRLRLGLFLSRGAWEPGYKTKGSTDERTSSINLTQSCLSVQKGTGIILTYRPSHGRHQALLCGKSRQGLSFLSPQGYRPGALDRALGAPVAFRADQQGISPSKPRPGIVHRVRYPCRLASRVELVA